MSFILFDMWLYLLDLSKQVNQALFREECEFFMSILLFENCIY